MGLFHLVGAWLEPPARPLPNPEIPIHVSVSLTNPRRPESPNKGKMPKSAVLKVTAASSPEVTTSLSAQFWLRLRTNPAHGRHVITPHLQRLKSLCFHLWVRLLWPPSLGPENLPRSWSAWIYPDTLFQFVLIWFTASADKPIMGVGGGQKTLSVGTEDFLPAFETKYFNMAKGKTPSEDWYRSFL